VARFVLRRRIVAVVTVAVTATLESVQEAKPVADFVGERTRVWAAADLQRHEAAVEVEQVLRNGGP
jgi:hypothetical protein